MQALCRPDRYLWLVGSDRLMRIVSAQKSDHKLVIAAKDAACILDERGHTDTLSNFAAEETLRVWYPVLLRGPALNWAMLQD